MNPDLERLHPYPFQKIKALLDGATGNPDLSPISLSIGEPKHPTPTLIHDAVTAHLNGLANYPLTKGTSLLRETIANWLTQRFTLPAASLDPEKNVIPVNGTREAIFAFAQAVVERRADAAVVIPNPFYQIYEGAALLAGAEAIYLNCTEDNGFIPDFAAVPANTWERCQLLYLCSPGNPTGSVMSIEQMQQVLALADKHDFIVASDECYSELYFDEDQPPPGLLQAAAHMANTDYKRCVVFHSLSKRSNAPGMRSGFIAGDAAILDAFLLYRTYHGCAMPPPFQAGSIAAWNDEAHVKANRGQYREKFSKVLEILAPVMNVEAPDAGFYLWPKTPISDTEFTRELLIQQHVNVVPGSYLSRDTAAGNPGNQRIRMALVATVEECVTAAERIRTFVTGLK